MTARAKWHRHPNGVNPPRWLRDWLSDRGSLTAKLMARAHAFQVRRLSQTQAMCVADEVRVLDLPRRQKVVEREVLLCCDGQAVVFAHTVVSLRASAADWPFFRALGERSLGSTLFNDPLVRRGAFSYARLPVTHVLVSRAMRHSGVQADAAPLLARRSVFRRKRGIMLVTEVFLPSLKTLQHGPGGMREPISDTTASTSHNAVSSLFQPGSHSIT